MYLSVGAKSNDYKRNIEDNTMTQFNDRKWRRDMLSEGKIKTINVEWMEEPKFKLEDIEINGKDLDRRKYDKFEKMLTKMTGIKVDFFNMYDIVLDGKLEKALKKHGIKLTMSLTDRS